VGGDESVVDDTRCACPGEECTGGQLGSDPRAGHHAGLLSLRGGHRPGRLSTPCRGLLRSTDDTWAMGLSPKRYRQSRPSDLAYVGSVVVVAVLLVAWALFG